MATSVNPAISPQVLETYTLLQIAAETFLGRQPEDPAAAPGDAPAVNLDADLLSRVGNLHSSRMTSAQAEQFS